FRNAADEEKAEAVSIAPKSVPKPPLVALRVEQLGIKAPWKDANLARVNSALDPALPVLLRVNKDRVQLIIKPVHVFPGQAFEKAILGQDADIFGEIGVINATRLQVQHLTREQTG